MAEFFLELFSEEIPANLQINFREKLLEEFREYFICLLYTSDAADD